MTETLVMLIRESEADRYRRDGWKVEPMPVCHHSRYRQMIATKPVQEVML